MALTLKSNLNRHPLRARGGTWLTGINPIKALMGAETWLINNELIRIMVNI